MTKPKSDAPNAEGQNQDSQERSGLIVEDRVKSIDSEQSGEPFGVQKEHQAAAGRKATTEQKP